jgi:hypothetical protein
MGVRDGDDFASYEKTLPILSDKLAAIMNWKSEEDYLYDYKLTKKQINAIEQTCSISLPDNLTLYITCSDS